MRHIALYNDYDDGTMKRANLKRKKERVKIIVDFLSLMFIFFSAAPAPVL